MSFVVAIFIIIAMMCFLLITAIKAWKYQRYPIHSRLELYPVPKEGNQRAHYGGSYFEEPRWWDKPRAIDGANEVKDILIEMLFIRKLFKNQKSLWWASYIFHLGIYVMFAWTLLLLFATIFPFSWLVTLTSAVGLLGFLLAPIGTILILVRRIFDATLRSHTTPLEYFNIILILFVLVTGLLSWFDVASPFDVARDLLPFGGSFAYGCQALAPIVAVHLVALGIMLIYIPLSKMSHYVGKFFAFHKVLWDNDPNQQGSQVNERIKKASSQPQQVTWSAPHIKTDGDKTDVEATEERS